MKTPEIKEKAVAKVKAAKGMMNEFKDFLHEYKILGIAAGLVIGSAVTALVQAIVMGLISPLIQLIMPTDALKMMFYEVNGVRFQYGIVINATINFIIIALLFFLFVKIVMKQPKVTKDSVPKA